MAARTRVVLTTVGPYQLYGSDLVAACAKAGTAYADLCGEPGWMREMIDAHQDATKASGARITFSCGFDRSEEHTSELQSLMRISYAVFCLKKKTLQQASTMLQNFTKHNNFNDMTI